MGRGTHTSLLVIGGARSGKSGFAQRAAEASGRRPVFIATATAFDGEMADRIAKHVADRDARWTTVDAPFDLPEAVEQATGPDRIVLVDCLTVWLGNLMHHGADDGAAAARLVAGLTQLAGPAIFVSNEVGAGIVPDHPLGRRFRDAQGRLNQAMAAACDAVVLVTAGLPLQLKPRADPTFVL